VQKPRLTRQNQRCRKHSSSVAQFIIISWPPQREIKIPSACHESYRFTSISWTKPQQYPRNRRNHKSTDTFTNVTEREKQEPNSSVTSCDGAKKRQGHGWQKKNNNQKVFKKVFKKFSKKRQKVFKVVKKLSKRKVVKKLSKTMKNKILATSAKKLS
jgi:hypothetical protein